MRAGEHVTPTIRLVRPLPPGGMGIVWIADHLSLGVQVAVKFMDPAFAANKQLMARFTQEAMAAAQVRTPHVAQVFDHGLTPAGDPYIVMELLEGQTLGQRLRLSGPRPLEEVVLIVGQAAKALGTAHRCNVIHRDIKPDNLFLLDVEGELFVKVIDFGIAKHMDPRAFLLRSGIPTATHSFLGTPPYMSPEQLNSPKHVDHRADLWSLAVCSLIHRTAGPQLAEMTARVGRCPRGSAVLTGAGQLPDPIRYVIHAVGPVYHGAREAECARQLRGAIQASLRLAEEHGVRSVAFPSLGTNDGYPLEKAASIALDTAAKHFDDAGVVEHIAFVLLTGVSYEVFARALATLAQRQFSGPHA